MSTADNTPIVSDEQLAKELAALKSKIMLPYLLLPRLDNPRAIHHKRECFVFPGKHIVKFNNRDVMYRDVLIPGEGLRIVRADRLRRNG